MPKPPPPEIVERLRAAGISICVVCGMPIIRQVKKPAGIGKFRRGWATRLYCSPACEQKAHRQRRKVKIIEDARRALKHRE